MSIERSIFNSKEEALNFVQSKYGLVPTNVERVRGGSANCYRLTVGDVYYFLKEFPYNFDKTALLREAKVCQMLEEKGVPTSVFIKTLKNDDTCAYRGRVFHLQKFLDGVALGKLSQEQLSASAEMLSSVHNALEEADFLRVAFRDEWFDNWTKEASIDRHRNIMEKLPLSKKAVMYQKRAADACQVKINLLRAYDYDSMNFKRLKKVNTHGDYNPLQILWDEKGEKITAVVDFSDAAKLPAVWEIARSYTLSAKECDRGERIDPASLWLYLQKYLEKAELSLFDIENMLPFYYYNLLRSTYGLDLTSKSALEFALWGTRLCQYLSVNERNITQYLREKYLELKK